MSKLSSVKATQAESAEVSTPSNDIVQGKITEVFVVDTLGRKLGVRRVDPLMRMRLFKAAGSVNSTNAVWLSMAIIAYSVSQINDEKIPPLQSELQIEAMVGRLGEEGMNAVGQAHADNYGVRVEDSEEIEAAKN